jgi:hypothetical protein
MAHRSWTETIIDLAPTSATSAVERPPGTVVLTIGWDQLTDPRTADAERKRHLHSERARSRPTTPGICL